MSRLLCLLTFLIVAVAARAATARAEGATLFINEVRVLTLRASSGDTGPIARAAALARRLNGKSEIELNLETSKRSAKIYESGELLILISKVEAARAGVSPTALASTWITNIRKAWAIPPLQLSPLEVKLPVGGSKTIDVYGRLARTAPMFVEDKAVAQANRKGATLTIKASGQGKTKLTLGEGEVAREVSVSVLPYAAYFPQYLSTTVVGAPTPAATIKSVVEGMLKGRLKTVDGATVSWSSFNANSLNPGEKTNIVVKVKADSPNSYLAEGSVTITVNNLAMAHRREAELWYCNEPENVKKPQNLFMAPLNADVPVRMLYHHINDSYQGLYLRVLATNQSSQPASVVIIPGDSKDKNPVLAGVMAADPFFRSWASGAGEVVTIAPGASLPIAFRRLAPQETSSGLCYLRLLQGGPSSVMVTTEAVLPYDLDDRWQAAQRTPTPWREVGSSTDLKPAYAPELSTLIFPAPFKQEEFTYRAGGNFSFFRIGQRPIPRENGKPLDGNFGVIYQIQAKAENPTQASADIELVFEASAGYSGGIFLIDGQFVRLPLLQSKGEARLARFKLDPGATKTISVSTIPLSGSSYPATLVLRPVSNLPDLPGR